MLRSAEAKKRRNALRRARFADGLRGLTRKPPLPSGRPDPCHIQTIDFDTYSFPDYFTAEFLQTTCPREGAASPPRQEGPSSPALPSATLTTDPYQGKSKSHRPLARRAPPQGLQGLPAKKVKYFVVQHPELYQYARTGQSWKSCVFSGPGVEASVYWRNPQRAAPTLVTRIADEEKVLHVHRNADCPGLWERKRTRPALLQRRPSGNSRPQAG